jgi:hypothetical protein
MLVSILRFFVVALLYPRQSAAFIARARIFEMLEEPFPASKKRKALPKQGL